ncbi:cupin domain-containing protein [Nonomuraea sp. NBC_01738]|uniref:cupin domain-containing protein n=1 Tax=Nonomuraea sp. NBC_01738 TaxID=2976003 RepID=UPI002E112B34|nr:cupin domain-containing protein [Nonomuraea sp. NBC_01738]
MSMIVRAADAETLVSPTTTGRLLLDSSDTGGALSTIRMTLAQGADGAVPHHHATSTELFYVLEGKARVLSGEEIVTLEAGDVAAVPPLTPHAFAAAPGHTADLLIVVAPGIQRFEYFRLLDRLRRGEATLDELLASQDLFDNHFLDSPAWTRDRQAS